METAVLLTLLCLHVSIYTNFTQLRHTNLTVLLTLLCLPSRSRGDLRRERGREGGRERLTGRHSKVCWAEREGGWEGGREGGREGGSAFSLSLSVFLSLLLSQADAGGALGPLQYRFFFGISEAVVGGDAKVTAIAAASIIAKGKISQKSEYSIYIEWIYTCIPGH
jgi:hypothetical protein